MSDLSKQVPFATSSPFETSSDGLESTPVELPEPTAPVSQPQRQRAEDLFLRGVLTKERLAKAVTDQSGFETVIGRSNFLPAVFLEVGAAVSRATCLIRTSGVNFRGQTGRWTGTGSLVSPNILLTNNHVINSRQVASAGECVFGFQLMMDGLPGQTRSFEMRPDRLFITSPAIGGLDFTFVWVEGHPGAEFGTVHINRNALIVAERDFANIVGHPDGRMKEVSLQENTVLWQDRTVVHYTSDTESGSSGASVANNEWQVFALHHANKPSNVTEHPILNEGIKLSAIAAHLEQVSQSGIGQASAAREVLRIFDGVDEELGFFGTLGRVTNNPNSELEAVVDTYYGDEQDIDVGFWNVEWMSNRWETKTKDVARVVHAMNLDIWALEESSPNAVKALVQELRETYELDYDWLAAEPNSSDNKQSFTLIWNKRTVHCQTDEWGEPIETWLNSSSRDFDDLGFEAVHGKIFNRYPGLFNVTAKREVVGQQANFYLVPLYLKARGEGSLRRKMASQILAAAVQYKIDHGADADWVIGGDVNAELASGDFAHLVSGNLTSVSAKDEQQGAFTYLKFHKSLIDHIFLSPNLAEQYGAEHFFIVAADRDLPNFVRNVSDHRPVLLRMSLNTTSSVANGSEARADNSAAKSQLKKFLQIHAAIDSSSVQGQRQAVNSPETRDATNLEARSIDLSDRKGFASSFLGGIEHRVPMPQLTGETSDQAVIVSSELEGFARHRLDYMHFTVVMNGNRRMPIYSAVNIDGTQLRKSPRPGWRFDPRIASSLQAGNDVYKHNDLDKGHMTRRLDPMWGTPKMAEIANRDSMFYTNAVPQHEDLNQKDWVQLEDYVMENSKIHSLRLSVITGPVFSQNDKPYRGILLPEEFWKVVVMRRSDTDELSATGYILTQKDLLTGFEFVFGEFKTFQVTLADIELRTGVDFGHLKDFDPKSRIGGLESAAGPVRIRGAESILVE